jgi:threonine dehydrogenase-like Zn-dependent dehydrogenase
MACACLATSSPLRAPELGASTALDLNPLKVPMSTMTAARAYRGVSELRLESISIPIPGPGEVLVKVASAGVAPGMMKLLEQGRFKHLPTTPGHEIAGTVHAVGNDVDSAWAGARVRVHPMLSCGQCAYCRSDREQLCSESAMVGHAAFGSGPMTLYSRYHNGGLAQFALAPVHLLDRLPDHVSFDVGAKVHDLANAVRALKCAGLPETGRIVITAATGTMGTATIKLARFYGARELLLVARSRERLDALRSLAGDLPVQLVALDELPVDWSTTAGLKARIRELMPSGPDAVLDYFPDGAGSLQAASSMAAGGTLVHMGGNGATPAFALRDLMIQCWRIVGTRACTRSDTDAVLELLGQRKLDAEDLITHRFSLAEVNRALEATKTRSVPIWMSVVHPQEAAA